MLIPVNLQLNVYCNVNSRCISVVEKLFRKSVMWYDNVRSGGGLFTTESQLLPTESCVEDLPCEAAAVVFWLTVHVTFLCAAHYLLY